jgi:glycosyltransferase involved in cell wall biosynthesis
VASLRYPPYVAGGYELSCAETVEELRARGWQVSVLCGRGERHTPGSDLFPDLEPSLDGEDPWLRVQRAGTREQWQRFMRHPGNQRATARALELSGAQLLLYFNLGLVTPAPLVAARALGVPTFGQIYDRWPTNLWLAGWRERGNKPLRRSFFEAAWKRLRAQAEWGHLWVPSASMQAELAAAGFDPGRLECVPLPLPQDVRPRAEARAQLPPTERAADEPLRLLCTSSHWPGKGVHVALEACRIAAESGVDLELELLGDGSGDHPAELRRLAAPLGERVRFAGRVPRSEVLAALERAHLLLFPSVWSEPYGLATLEALASGVPVLASDAGASGELVRDGVDGRVLPPADPGALAAALAELAADENRRRSWARAGRERILSGYRHADFYDRLHRACLERARTPGVAR